MKTFALVQPVDGKTTWSDGKRYAWLLGLLVPVLPLLAIALHALTGWTVALWFGPIVVLGIVPAIDLFAGNDPTNPPEEVMAELEEDRYYRWVTYLYIPLQYVGLIVGMALIASAGYSVVGKIGLACSLGTVSGVGINTAHELGHKKDVVERWLSKIVLAQCFYGHFYIEHNRGHHVNVATPNDPASSRMGESFYRFWPRTVLGSARSAWAIEAKRHARRDTHPFHLGNDVLNAWLMSVVLWGGLIAVLGIGVLPYLLIQAVFGFTLLELVNYMEHYGLRRQQVGSGDRVRYEQVRPEHSWNSNQTATNVLLYHLQRHSDHHANPTRRYQTLRDFAEAPVLPTGYTGMMLVSTVPPLFRRLMDRRLVAHFGGDLTRANVQPGKLEKIQARYAGTPAPSGPSPAEDRPVQPVPTAPAAEVHAARCPGCDYTYLVAEGNELEGFAAGTPWSAIPEDWRCPDCGVREKADFAPLEPVEA